jgi:hypothetical protein
MSPSTGRIHEIFLLNIALQLFDGVATYHGMPFWGEGNPVLLTLVPYLGAGITLLLCKQIACGCLCILRRLEGRPFVFESLAGLAAVYGCFSFIPWMSRFLSLLSA